MPSSPLSVRPVLTALLAALLMASSVLVSGSSTLLPAARAAGGNTASEAPAAPPGPAAGSPVSVDLVSLTPTSLAPGGTLEATIEVTNTSSEPLSALSLELRTHTSRVTDRAVLAKWQADTSPDTSGTAIADSPEHPELAPGDWATLTVQVSAEELNYSEEPYHWGTRRLSLTVVAEQQPLTALRSFVVWRPADVEATITQSVLLPLAAQDASAVVTAPDTFQTSAESGRLAALRELAPREDVDWWLDPALLDPPSLPAPLEAPPAGAEETAAEDDAPEPVRSFRPDPASAEIADTLDGAVGERTVLAMPYARADVRSLHSAGADVLRGAVQDRADQVWEERGILPRAAALPVAGPTASAETFEALLAAGATAAVVPASSLRTDPAADVTPSSIGVFESARTEGALLPLLAPDPTLSSEFSLLTAGSDTEQTQQRLLAETATIASEYTAAPRHLLIAPSPDAPLDAAAAGAALDALAEAPWIEGGSTAALLDAADQQAWTTQPQSETGELLALGAVRAEDIRPSGPTGNSRWEHLPPAQDPALLDPEVLAELEGTWQRLDALDAVMQDDAPLDAPRLEILAGTSMRWRGAPEIPAQRAQDAAALTAALQDRIQVVPASGYNVISDVAGVPITISNGLDTPITVRIQVSSDKPLVRIGEPEVVEVPARGQVDATVDVEAVANGSVTLTTVVTTEDGRALTAPVDVPLTVNPSWENWTTMLMVIAMGALVVVGVARARRTGASTRAPAVRDPEDPEELARSGRSTIDPRAAAPLGAPRAGPSADDPPAAPDRTQTPHPDRAKEDRR